MATKVIAAEIVLKGLKESGLSVKELKEVIEGMKDELVKVEAEFGKTSQEAVVTRDAIKKMETAVDQFGKQAVGSVGSFKTQLLQAKENLYAVTKEFGATSAEAAEAAKHVADLNDVIGDAKALTEDFNPDKKFVALGGAIQGVVAGFSAYSGVMGLLGIKSEETEKLLLRVQSAMALQQGISGIMAAKDSVELLISSITKSTVVQKANTVATTIATGVQRLFGASVVGTGTAFNVLKSAIIATGIGALVVAIGIAIDKLNLFGDAADSAAKKQERLNDAIQKNSEFVSSGLALIDRQIELDVKRAKIAGESEDVITNILMQGVDKRVAFLEREISDAKKLGLDFSEFQKQIDLENMKYMDLSLDRELRHAEAGRNKKKDTKKTEAKEDVDAEKKKQMDLLAEQVAGQLKSIDSDIEAEQIKFENEQAFAEQKRQDIIDNQQKQLKTKAQLAELAVLNDPDSIENKIAKINADLELELAALAEGDIQRQILAKQASDAIVQVKKDEAEAKKEIAQKEFDFQMTIANGIADGLDTLAQVAGKQTAAGKVLAIASTVIKTIQGGIAAFTGMVSSIPGPVGIALGAVAAAGVVASGVKAVKQITAVKVPFGGSGGSAPNISLPGAPLQPQAQTTNLNQNSINAIGNATSRAYVLETDVSGNQERIARLNRAARIN